MLNGEFYSRISSLYLKMYALTVLKIRKHSFNLYLWFDPSKVYDSNSLHYRTQIRS